VDNGGRNSDEVEGSGAMRDEISVTNTDRTESTVNNGGLNRDEVVDSRAIRPELTPGAEGGQTVIGAQITDVYREENTPRTDEDFLNDWFRPDVLASLPGPNVTCRGD